LMHGSVSYTSKINEGTTFTLHFYKAFKHTP